MKKLNIPKDIRQYVFKRRIPYAISFLLLMAVIAFICISSEFIPPIGTVIGLIVAFVIFYNLSVFKNNLFDKTFWGEVIKIKDLSLELPLRRSSIALPYRKYFQSYVKFTLKNGDEVFDRIIPIPENTPLNSFMDIYPVGSYILHIGGTKQYVVFKEEQKSYICPVCGIKNKISADKCVDCGHTLIKSITENTGT